MRSKLGIYEYEVIQQPGRDHKWFYLIYDPDNTQSRLPLVESLEYFASEQRAQLAAIGHISIIEKKLEHLNPLIVYLSSNWSY